MHLNSEAALNRCSFEKMSVKYAANLQENTHAEMRFQWWVDLLYLLQEMISCARFVWSALKVIFHWNAQLPIAKQIIIIISKQLRIEIKIIRQIVYVYFIKQRLKSETLMYFYINACPRRVFYI